MNPQDFVTLKQKIEQSSILSDKEKKEWLFLLPKMNQEQIEELDRIVSIKLPEAKKPAPEIKPAPSPVKVTPAPKPELKLTDIKPQVQPPIQQPKVEPKLVEVKPAAPAVEPTPVAVKANPETAAYSAIKLEDLHRAPSVYIFLEELEKKMKNQSERTNFYDMVTAFETSPLYKAYLASGLGFMAGKKDQDLSHEEFEAIADFHAAIKRLG